MSEKKVLLEMKGICKRFSGVIALNNVDLKLERGQVLALLGENGAGKSTLLKILSGAYIADEGEIYINGEKQNYKNPLDAIDAGVSIIYQELNYYNDFTVAENIFVGRLPKYKSGLINWKKLNADAKEVLNKLGVKIDPKTIMKKLTTAEKQMVEIAKSISKKMDILVMDEPSAALSDEEVNNLIEIIKQLANTGIGIVYISHRLEELFMVSDKVQVLRDGEYIDTFDTDKTDRDELVKAMVGRSIDDMYPKRELPIGDVIFEVKDLSSHAIKDISFNVRSGEILGVFGLMGSGRTNLCESIFGLDKSTSGTVIVNGKYVNIKSPSDAKKAGLAYVPSERKTEGLIMIQSVRENLSSAILDKVKKLGIIRKRQEEENARKWVNNLSIKTPKIDSIIETLSGGNQQKVVLGKWLETNPSMIILNEPTRGIDVGAKVEIYQLMEKLCEEGLGVLFISSEQPELLGLADRIIVMCEGELTGCMSRNEFCCEGLLNYAIGGC